MIKKGNKLREQGVERETVIEIIRNNKDKINAFLETQTTTPKTLKGLADGGRIGFSGGGSYDYGSMQYKIDSVKAAYKKYKKGSQTSGRGGVMTFEQFAPLFAAENFADGGRIGFQDGLNFDKAIEKMLEKETEEYKPVDISVEGEKILKEKLTPFIPKTEKEIKKNKKMKCLKWLKSFKNLKKITLTLELIFLCLETKRKKKKLYLKTKY